MPRVIHFEINSEQPERAVRFYESVFGWQIHKWDGPMDYWLAQTGADGTPGINGGLAQVNPVVTTPSTVNTVEVDSVDAYVAKVTENGGSVVMPKSPIPGIGYLAYCKDTEGIVFGILQVDATAA